MTESLAASNTYDSGVWRGFYFKLKEVPQLKRFGEKVITLTEQGRATSCMASDEEEAQFASDQVRASCTVNVSAAGKANPPAVFALRLFSLRIRRREDTRQREAMTSVVYVG